MGSILESHDASQGVGTSQQALSNAFFSEFGSKPIDKAGLQNSQSSFARILESHFDEVANLKDRRDGVPSWL
jgi:hypothetical protein